jgi:hypothetical protein
MKTWKTAVRAMGCGYDITHRIAQGEAYLELEDSTGRKRVRCSRCAVRYETHVATEPVSDAPTDAVGPGDASADDWGGADGEEPAIAEPEPEPELEGDPW